MAKRIPAVLSREAKSWFKKIRDEYSIDDPAGLIILQTAMEALDRLREAQKIIADEGPTFLDRFDQKKPNPAIGIERDARFALLASIKQLNLDLEPLRDIGRPPGS